ncbi:ParA family protein [Staphylococcus nepalensis]|uniref:ParA family protein n=1 Tax=Staphylococcus TaxID=1279 RepID=UPI000DFC7B98|nr:ParA family protein [Staphylococcus saprophyticus]SUM62995.1 chromosome partitioning ATPase [Staphylococcus saprophyticus]
MNAKIVSFINMKGGVGKTTLTINLAYTLMKEKNKKVLIVDMDPQFNATQALFTKFKSISEYEELINVKTILAILQPDDRSITEGERKTKVEDIIINLENSLYGKLDIIPGDLNLTSFESSDRGSEKLLNRNMNIIKEDYDYIFIDTPATYSVYGQTALLASDYYVVPVLPDTFASLGHDLLENKVENDIVLEDMKPTKLGVIITLSKPNKAKRQAIIDSFDGIKFKNELFENEHIRSGNFDNFIYDMSSTKENIKELTNELIEKINEVE